MHQNPSQAEIAELLGSATTIAVIGLSEDPGRPSFGVARELRGFGLRVIPVNPHLKTPILGEKPYASLADIPERIDIVDIFRRPEFAPDIAREAVTANAGMLWMQLGVISDEAAGIASSAGIPVVMNRCLAVDYRNLTQK